MTNYQLNDPDFDLAAKQQPITPYQFPAKAVFFFGVVNAILVLCTIGFFILLALIL
ncbi:MAG: hypothetical protein AAB408_04390 [Patescibacteria group bacterium]